MKKLLLLSLSLILMSAELSAQAHSQNPLDSLFSELPKARKDTNKVKLLINISFTYRNMKPDSGIIYGQEAFRLAEQLNWKKGMADAYNAIGVNYNLKSDFQNGLDNFIKSIKLYEESGYKPGIAKVAHNIGTIYVYQEKYDKALEYTLRALKLNEELGNDVFIRNNIANIGIIYGLQKDYPNALKYNLIALNMYEELGDKGGMALVLGNIASFYSDQKIYAKALKYYQEALDAYDNDVVDNRPADVLQGVGAVFLEIAKQSRPDADSLLKALFAGNKYMALQRAKLYTDSANKILRDIGSLDVLIHNYKQLSEIQSLSGDMQGALESYKNYSSIKDSVFNMEKDKKLTESAMQYEFDKKEAAAKAEREKKDIQHRNVRNSISAGLAGSLIFLAVVYRQRNKISKARKRSDELLLNILPSEVADELKEKGSADAKQFDEVTVMFTDFKGFTQISEKLSPTELVNEIHLCFKAFDDIIGKHNIEKIKTIGDAYMCASGLPVANKTHAKDMVQAALEIQQFMVEHAEQRNKTNREVFEIRIGINTGPVVAGIVGVKKFAYDIWGDTVNIASRMESSGEPGKVNISGATYELVKDDFYCIHRGKIQAKNKGEIDMYFVEPVL